MPYLLGQILYRKVINRRSFLVALMFPLQLALHCQCLSHQALTLFFALLKILMKLWESSGECVDITLSSPFKNQCLRVKAPVCVNQQCCSSSIRVGWGPGQLWSSGWQPCLQQEGWKWMILTVSSNPSHSLVVQVFHLKQWVFSDDHFKH